MVDIAGILGGRGSGIKIGSNGDGRRSDGRCRGGGGGGVWSQWHHPKPHPLAPVAANYCLAAIHDSASNLCKGDGTTRIALCYDKPGMMWADCAPGGNDGRSSVHVCVECTHLPFRKWVMMGIVVGRMLVAGVLVFRKWLLFDGVGINADCFKKN